MIYCDKITLWCFNAIKNTLYHDNFTIIINDRIPNNNYEFTSIDEATMRLKYL